MDSKHLRGRTWLIAGGVIILIIFFYFVDLGELVIGLQNINWWQIGMATLALLAGHTLLTVRLRYILSHQTGWWKTFYANSIGYMVHIAMFGPNLVARTVSLDTVASVPLPQASSALLIERLLEQVMRLSATILVIALLASEQTHPTTSVGASFLLLIALFGAIFWMTHHREQIVNGLAARVDRWGYASEQTVRQTATNVLQSLDAVSTTRRLLTNLLLSYATWTSFLVFQYLVLVALEFNLPASQRWLIAAAVLAIMPPSVNVMLIIYHVVVVGLLVTFQLTDMTTAVIYAVVLHLIQMVFWIVLGRWAFYRTGLSLRQMIGMVKEQIQQQKSVKDDAKRSTA